MSRVEDPRADTYPPWRQSEHKSQSCVRRCWCSCTRYCSSVCAETGGEVTRGKTERTYKMVVPIAAAAPKAYSLAQSWPTRARKDALVQSIATLTAMHLTCRASFLIFGIQWVNWQTSTPARRVSKITLRFVSRCCSSVGGRRTEIYTGRGRSDSRHELRAKTEIMVVAGVVCLGDLLCVHVVLNGHVGVWGGMWECI